MELETIALWIVGAALLAAGGMLIGYSLGSKAGERRSNLAKDLRIRVKEEQIARLEKSLKLLQEDTSQQTSKEGDRD